MTGKALLALRISGAVLLAAGTIMTAVVDFVMPESKVVECFKTALNTFNKKEI